MSVAAGPKADTEVTADAAISGTMNTAQGAREPDRLAFEAAFEAPQLLVAGWGELCLGFTTLAVWFLLFAGGILVGTKPYISTLSAATAVSEVVGAALVILLFWTITNVGILSILAATLGAFGRRTRFTRRVALHGMDIPGDVKEKQDRRAVTIHCASAVMRGFGVYALVLSGLLVLATEALVAPTQGQYVRMASMISVVSFYAGYDPEMFAGFLDRIKRFIQST